MKNPLKKIKFSVIGYAFLGIMVLNVIGTNILRIAGVSILYNNTTRIFVMLQIIAVALLAWILGWVNDNGDKE